MKWQKMNMYYNMHIIFIITIIKICIQQSPNRISRFLVLIAVSAMFGGIWAYAFVQTKQLMMMVGDDFA